MGMTPAIVFDDVSGALSSTHTAYRSDGTALYHISQSLMIPFSRPGMASSTALHNHPAKALREITV